MVQRETMTTHDDNHDDDHMALVEQAVDILRQAYLDGPPAKEL